MKRRMGIVLAASIVSSGCGSESTHPGGGASGGAPDHGGSTTFSGGASGGPGTRSTGGVGSPGASGSGGAAAGSAGATSNGAANAGGVASSAAGGVAAASGGAGGTSTASGAGGATASGGRDGTGGSYPNLAVFGNTTTLELAPVLLAAKSVYPGKATVTNGGIPNLWSGADLATNAETQALVQSVTHSNLRIVFTVCEGFYRIVARRSAGIATLADLRGKRIATVPGTSSAYFLHDMLATVNLDDSAVTIVPSAAPTQIPGSLTRHEVDAATIWEPAIQSAADALGTDAVEFQDRSVYRELFDLHTTAEKLANPDTRRGIVEFLRALMTASSTITAQPSSVWPLVATTTGFDSTLIGESWKNEGFAGTLAPDLLDVLVQEDAWLAKSGGRAARTRDVLASLIDDSLLLEAMMPP